MSVFPGGRDAGSTDTVTTPPRLTAPIVTPGPFPAVTGIASPSGIKSNGPAIGVWFLGGMVVLALADTKAAPVLTAFLAAAAIYNAGPLLNKLVNGGSSSGGSSGSSGSGSPPLFGTPSNPLFRGIGSGVNAGNP